MCVSWCPSAPPVAVLYRLIVTQACQGPRRSLLSGLMSDDKIYAVPQATAARAWIDNKRYEALYRESLENTEAFWAKQARDRLDWLTPFSQVKDTSFDATHLHVRWFADGKLTYRELHAAVCAFANALKERGVAKGDRVTIYMPMIPETVVAMLACAR